MYRLRKICLVVFFSLFSIIFSVMGFSTITHAEEAGFNLMFSETLFKTYVVGDTVTLPKPVESVEYYILVEKKEGDSLIIKKEITDINSKFTFEETGEYIISYVYKVNDKTCNTNINVTVEEFKNGFDFSAFPEKISVNKSIEFGNVYYYTNQIKRVCDVVIIDPNGNNVDISNGVFKPNAIGVHTLKAQAGKNISEIHKFEVVASSANLFESDNVKIAENYNLPSWSEKGNGVLLYTNQDYATVRYSNIVDLKGLDPNIPLIKFQALYGYDETTGIDFICLGDRVLGIQKEWLQVKITDIYDPNKYVNFAWRAGEYAFYGSPDLMGYSYLMTCPGAYTMQKWGDFAGDGVIDSQYSTFYGAEGAQYGGGQLFDVSYSYDSNTSYFSNGSTLFSNYTDTNRWGKYAFDNFTTGEVYLDITFGYWNGDGTGGIVVTEVAGTSLSGENVNSLENVSSKTVNDKTAPVVKINTEKEYLKSMPNGEVGMPYPVPTAYANDAFSGRGDVYTTVTLDGKQYQIANNEFVPDKIGTYKINYFATDAFGNNAMESLTVSVVDDIGPISFRFLEEVVPVVGRYVNFGSLEVIGGSGNISYDYNIYYNGEKVQTDNFNKLYLDKAGKLKIVFNASDYLNSEIDNKVVEYDVVVKDDVFITIDGYVQKYAQKASTITLPNFFVKTFGENSNITKKILVNGNEINGFEYFVSENVGEKIKVTYLATNKGVDYKEEFEIAVIEEYTSVENGFIRENVSAKLTKNNLSFTLNENAKIYAPNVVVARNFKLSFNIKLSDIDYMDIVFSDITTDNTVTLRMSKSSDAGKIDMFISGKRYSFQPDSLLSDVYAVSLICNLVSGRIATMSDVTIGTVTKFDAGYAFTGFTNDLVYVGLNFAGCKGNVEFNVDTFSNQTFNQFSDLLAIGPQIKGDKEIASREVEKGETIIIPVMTGYDLFDGESEVYITITAPDRTKIISSKLCDAENSFVATKEGTYVVTFTSYDYHDGLSTISYRYTVMDKEAPSIQVEKSKINAKVGEKVIVPTARVADNVTQDMRYYVFVVMPEGNYVVVENNEFTFAEAGSYEIVYVAIDLQDNIARKVIKVTVTE